MSEHPVEQRIDEIIGEYGLSWWHKARNDKAETPSHESEIRRKILQVVYGQMPFIEQTHRADGSGLPKATMTFELYQALKNARREEATPMSENPIEQRIVEILNDWPVDMLAKDILRQILQVVEKELVEFIGSKDLHQALKNAREEK